MHLDQQSERAWDKTFAVQPCWQVLLLKYRNGGKGLQKTLTDVSLEHHEECACVCKDDWDWPPTGVVVATRNTRDVNTEPLPLYLTHFHWKLTRSPPPPPLPCCPSSNWIKQKRLESRESDRIRLLWNTNSVALSAFLFLKTGKKENHWSRFWWLSLCSEDYIVLLLWVKNTEVFLALFPEAFFKVLPAWAGTVMENGGFFVQRFWFFHAYIHIYTYYIYVCEWAGCSCLTPLTPINTIKPPFAFLLIYQVKCSYDNLKMLCLLNCIYIYIYFLHICAFFFYQKFSK